MTGSLLQLVAIGNEDYFFIGNPQISFFKRVYLKHTNFSIERMEIYNEGRQQFKDNKTYTFNINPEYGDLLYYTAFHIKLPEIYSDTDFQFRWIKNLGDNIIDECSIYINDTLLEKIENPFLHVSNSLHLNNNSKNIYNKLTKNINDLYNPGHNGEYPYSSSNKNYNTSPDNYLLLNKHYSELPSIDKQTLYIPLAFFLNRIKEFFIPLVLLRNSTIKIEVKLRSIHDLYTIGYPNSSSSYGYTNDYYLHQNFAQNSRKTITDFVKNKNYFLDCDIKLYTYIIFLEAQERQLLSKNTLNNLVTIPKKYNFIGLTGSKLITIKNKDLIDKIFIIPRRDDIKERNQWLNSSIHDYDIFDVRGLLNETDNSKLANYWYYRRPLEIPKITKDNLDYFETPHIIKKLTVKLNGDILDELDDPHFLYNSNKFESFTNNYLRDIIIYKFSEFPLEYQPSGHFNLNSVNRFELELEFADNKKDIKPYNFDVDIILMTFKNIIFSKDSVSIV